jgi:hypothetical protein
VILYDEGFRALRKSSRNVKRVETRRIHSRKHNRECTHINPVSYKFSLSEFLCIIKTFSLHEKTIKCDNYWQENFLKGGYMTEGGREKI